MARLSLVFLYANVELETWPTSLLLCRGGLLTLVSVTDVTTSHFRFPWSLTFGLHQSPGITGVYYRIRLGFQRSFFTGGAVRLLLEIHDLRLSTGSRFSMIVPFFKVRSSTPHTITVVYQHQFLLPSKLFTPAFVSNRWTLWLIDGGSGFCLDFCSWEYSWSSSVFRFWLLVERSVPSFFHYLFVSREPYFVLRFKGMEFSLGLI